MGRMSRLMRDLSPGTYVVNPGTLSSTKPAGQGPCPPSLHQEDGVATLHLFDTYALGTGRASGVLGAPRALTVRLAHLPFMDPKADTENPTTRPQLRLIEQVLSLSELCAHLQVSCPDDLRPAQPGPRAQGFRSRPRAPLPDQRGRGLAGADGAR